MSKPRAELLTNAQFNQIVKAGPYQVIDAVTGKKYSVCFGGPRNDHYDVTPERESDARTMEQILGRADLNLWRPARPVHIVAGARLIAAGICGFMHHIRIGGGNPGPKYPSRSQAGPPWDRGGHVCLYLSDSVGGGGDAPNAACSPEANAHAGKIHGGGRGGQARAACYEAYLLGKAGEEEEMTQEITQEQFNRLMEGFVSHLQKQPASKWAAEEGSWAKATQPGAGAIRGGMPRMYVERQELAAILDRLGLLPELSAGGGQVK